MHIATKENINKLFTFIFYFTSLFYKTMTEQHRKPQISHAEAALMSGRPYEKANVGHDKMYDTFGELETAHKEQHKHGVTNTQSRDNRIDQELAAEDKEILERKNESRRQREQHKHSEQQHQ